MKKYFHFMLAIFSLLSTAILLQGCSELLIFNPKGPIGYSERSIIIVSFILMLIVVIPVIIMSIWFPLKFKSSNTKSTYAPMWSHSVKIETVMWLIPLAIVFLLSILAWRETHRLDPYRPIVSDAKPLNIEVVSMDWKWLFIYPEQQIAVVNQFVFPANVPLSFQITSDSVMTSFFIPQLGSQIYAMAGMRTRLHLMANEPGVYAGQNQQFSGRGYPFMNFDAVATSREDFEAWVQKVQQSPEKLDFTRLDELRKPSVNLPVAYFSSIEPGLFDYIMSTYQPMPMDPNAPHLAAPPAHETIGDLEVR